MAELIDTEQSSIPIEEIKLVFSQIHDEFEEHLSAINENTDEIQTNHAYICEIDNKLARLNKRIDEIHHILSKLTGKKLRKIPAFEDIDPLTAAEKSVFLNLYTESRPISYAELAKKLNMSINLSRHYVVNLMEKGIPIQKIYKNTKPHILLDPKFKNLQAKKNILKIEQRVLV